MSNPPHFNPALDLTLDRYTDAPRPLVWSAWTQAEHLKQWFTPRPWTIPECQVDLRAGGHLKVLMRSPDGKEESRIDACYLEVVANERLVWTDALVAGYRPATTPFITATITLKDEGHGTRYTAHVMHRDAAERKRHEDMGFFDGWGTVFAQLAAHVEGL